MVAPLPARRARLLTQLLRSRIFAIAGLPLAGGCAASSGEDASASVAVVTADIATPPRATATVTTTDAVSTASAAPSAEPGVGRSPWKTGGHYCAVFDPATENAVPGTGCPNNPRHETFATVEPPSGMHGYRYDALATQNERIRVANACCYGVSRPVRGRPLRSQDVDRSPVTAGPRARADWALELDVDVAHAPASERAKLASSWEREGALEHASAAELARFALGLMALGAPAELVTRALRAAQDEVDHATIAYGIASRWAGEPLGPDALAVTKAGPATLDLVALTLETLQDGCLGETLASLEAAREAELTSDPVVADALARIAEDEARHAELAYAVVAWAMSVASDAQRARIREGAAPWLDALRSQARAENRHGDVRCLTARERRSLHELATEQIVLPAVGALLAAAPARGT